MYDKDEIKNIIMEVLQTLIKVGSISKVTPEKHTARVVFEEDEAVSFDLPIMIKNSLENKDYALPDVGEDAIVLMLPNGHEDGFILGSFYAQGCDLPTTNGQERKVKFNDETEVIYNRETHQLDIIIENTTIKANRETVDITGAKTIHLKAVDEITLTDDTKVIINAPEVTVNADNKCTVNTETCTINASSNVKIDTPNTKITGNVSIDGNVKIQGSVNTSSTITASGDVKGAGKSLSSHKHNGKHGPTSPPI